MTIPTRPMPFMRLIYQEVLPIVHEELRFWKVHAKRIPNEELRSQALQSIEEKTFHCEGGAIMALLAPHEVRRGVIRFIVAYQTISDYLDNLCDRSTSLDPDDFSALHESMHHAILVGAEPTNYYRFREDCDDAGYLATLMKTCQEVLAKMENYTVINPYLGTLCGHYVNLQVHKHVRKEEREARLIALYESAKDDLPPMTWYEFAACAGSTLGIFCLVSYAMRKDFDGAIAKQLYEGYFPYIQGIHILLDYFIDQQEDLEEGDLNFCFYYENEAELQARLLYFIREAGKCAEQLPHSTFHQYIIQGMLGIYLSDRKVMRQRNVQAVARALMKEARHAGKFFYWNGRMYRFVQQKVPFIRKKFVQAD